MSAALSLQIISSILGNSTGFIAKQLFCYYGLEKIRTQLDKAISTVAQQYFGRFVGQAVGSHCAAAASIPYTMFLGDLIWSYINETMQSSIWLIARMNRVVPKNVKTIPFWLRSAIHASTYALGFFTKCAIAHRCMPAIKVGIEFLIRENLGQKISQPILKKYVFMVASFGAVVITPSVTFIAADVLASVVQIVTASLGIKVATVVYNAPFSSSQKQVRIENAVVVA